MQLCATAGEASSAAAATATSAGRAPLRAPSPAMPQPRRSGDCPGAEQLRQRHRIILEGFARRQPPIMGAHLGAPGLTNNVRIVLALQGLLGTAHRHPARGAALLPSARPRIMHAA